MLTLGERDQARRTIDAVTAKDSVLRAAPRAEANGPIVTRDVFNPPGLKYVQEEHPIEIKTGEDPRREVPET
jgi:hypothetical protein